MTDGRVHEADALVPRHRLKVSKMLFPMKIFGRDGASCTMSGATTTPKLSRPHVPGFPNFFILTARTRASPMAATRSS